MDLRDEQESSQLQGNILKNIIPHILRTNPELKRKAEDLKELRAKRFCLMKTLDQIHLEEEALQFELEQGIQDSKPWIMRFASIVQGEARSKGEFGLSSAMLSELVFPGDPDEASEKLKEALNVLDNVVADDHIVSLLREDLLHIVKCTMQLRETLRATQMDLDCRFREIVQKLAMRLAYYDWSTIQPAEAEVSRRLLDSTNLPEFLPKTILKSLLKIKKEAS